MCSDCSKFNDVSVLLAFETWPASQFQRFVWVGNASSQSFDISKFVFIYVYIMSQRISVHTTPWDVRFQFHAQNGGRSMLKLHDSAQWHQIRLLYSDLQGINNPVAAALYPWKLTWPIAQCHERLIWFTRGDKIHYMQAEGAEDVN